jgi:hypothetical protein
LLKLAMTHRLTAIPNSEKPIAMTLDELEAEVRRLPEKPRAELLARLLAAFDESLAIDAQIAEAWAEEAAKRDEEMGADDGAGMLASEVFRELRHGGE